MPKKARNGGSHIILIALILLTSWSHAQVQNDFSGYPAGAQQCLYDAADSSGCDGDTVAAMNVCLCRNDGDFVTDSGTCVAKKDPDDMEATWEVMDLHCSDSNTPLAISKEDWMALKNSVTSSATPTRTSTSSKVSTKSSTSKTATSSAKTTSGATTANGHTVTATVTSTPASTASPAPDSSGGLSAGARAGVIAGTSVAAAVLIAVAVFFIWRYHKRRSHGPEESHPMLPVPLGYSGGGADGSGGYGAGEMSTKNGHLSMAPSEQKIAAAGWKSAPLTNRESAPGTWQPQDGEYPWSPSGFFAYAQQRQSLHQPPPPDVYEMPTAQEHNRLSAQALAPVEMPAISVSSPSGRQYPENGWESNPDRYEPYQSSR